MASKSLTVERKHAQQMANVQRQPWHIFKTGRDSLAYLHGVRYGSFRDSERTIYVDEDGHKILETVYPQE